VTATGSRIPLVRDHDSELAEILAKTVVRNGEPINLFLILAHHPELLKRWNALGRALLAGELPRRLREIVILRTAWQVGGSYPFSEHIRNAAAEGLSSDQIAVLTKRTAAGTWSDAERDLIEITDELCAGNDIADATWSRISGQWTDKELVEIVILVGYYRLVGMFTRALRIPVEEDVESWPTDEWS